MQVPSISSWSQNKDIGTLEMWVLSWVKHLVGVCDRMLGLSENKVSGCSCEDRGVLQPNGIESERGESWMANLSDDVDDMGLSRPTQWKRMFWQG